MSRTVSIALAGLFLVGAVTAFMPSAVAASSAWYPDDNGVLLDVATQNNCPPYGIVPISDGATQTWKADLPAAQDVDFGADPFSYHLEIVSAFAGTATLYVGSMSGLTFTSFGQASLIGGPATTLNGNFVTTAPQKVLAGDYLTFQLVNNNDATGGTARRIRVETGCQQSFFSSGESDPGYPTPELATLALVGAGVLGVGALALRRRN